MHCVLTFPCIIKRWVCASDWRPFQHLIILNVYLGKEYKRLQKSEAAFFPDWNTLENNLLIQPEVFLAGSKYRKLSIAAVQCACVRNTEHGQFVLW